MGYFKNLWSALIGTSNKKVVKKNKYAPAKEKIIKIENKENQYSYNELANILGFDNPSLSYTLYQHKKYNENKPLIKTSGQGQKDKKLYTQKDLEKIKKSKYYKNNLDNYKRKNKWIEHIIK